MQTVSRTQDIERAERKYFDAFHYVQVAAADPRASLTDKKDCLGYLSRAFDQWAKLIQQQHRKQYNTAPPIAEVRDRLKEYVTDALNARNLIQEGP